MSHVTTFTCDRCGSSWAVESESEPQRIRVAVAVGHLPDAHLLYQMTVKLGVDLCRPCADALHLFVAPRLKGGVVAPTRAERLEELLREIVREESPQP